jgi:cytidylate kinase
VVTVWAAFGAGGSVVGPAVADRLGLPFVDRFIPAAVAEALNMPIGRVLAHDEKKSGVFSRIIAKLGATSLPYGATPVPGAEPLVDDDVFRDRTEEVIRDLADGDGGVVLGRGAAIILRGRPGVLHVRLDGPRAARVARIQERQGVSEERASELVDEADGAREAYIRHFYKADMHDSRLFHLVIDSLAVPLDTCTDLIVQAAGARN